MAIREIRVSDFDQECIKCGRVVAVPFTAIAAGVSREGQVNPNVVALPVCAACGSAEFLLRSPYDEEHPSQGSYGHKHKLLVDKLHAELVQRGSHFSEDDKMVVAAVQKDLLSKTLPAYRDATARGQIELSTSPYFHPILPLLINSDSARIASADVILPRRRFAHPEDAAEQIRLAVDKHQASFGTRPAGIWCSEQAVGEDVIPLLLRAGFQWTISDESVLSRSLAGVHSPIIAQQATATRASSPPISSGGTTINPFGPHIPYRLDREDGSMAIIFRDHTLSDLIGFAYNSWDSRDAANDLLRRLREIRAHLAAQRSSAQPRGSAVPLVTIALDGENAWEYYPRDGRDFLQHLYEGLSADSGFRCVTISEHLHEAPAAIPLDWLHTGSWISANLRTWIGDPAHDAAWDLLPAARDTAARFSQADPSAADAGAPRPSASTLEEARHHVLVAEGSDWFWWFGEHHHTELDAVWDLNFRRHLEAVYRLLETEVPASLFFPVIADAATRMAKAPRGPIHPVIDGVIGTGIAEPTDSSATRGVNPDAPTSEWTDAGILAPVVASTMQRAESTYIREIRFGWDNSHLCLLVVPEPRSRLEGLEIEVRLVRSLGTEDLVLTSTLLPGGSVHTECTLCPQSALQTVGAWNEVVELAVALPAQDGTATQEEVGLLVRVGREGMADYVFHSAHLGHHRGVDG
jgi:hypothetical protein